MSKVENHKFSDVLTQKVEKLKGVKPDLIRALPRFQRRQFFKLVKEGLSELSALNFAKDLKKRK